MAFQVLPQVLEQESFQRIDRRWRPTDLFLVQQVRLLLKDMGMRYDRLASAQSELLTLVRGDVYIKLLRRMRIWLRSAMFNWRADHLRLAQAIGGFYGDYGTILRLLKNEQARGTF